MSDERPGLLETAARARGHYQKRAYACVKLLVGVMCRAPAAVRAVHAHTDARRRWRQLLAWLQDELDRVTTAFIFCTSFFETACGKSLDVGGFGPVTLEITLGGLCSAVDSKGLR